jgi:hypothetical protein
MIRAAGAPVTGLASVGAFISPEVVPGANGSFGGVAVGPNGQVLVTYQDFGTNNILVSLDPDGLGPQGFGQRVLASTTNVSTTAFLPAQSNDEGIDAEANLAWDRSSGPHNGRVYLVYTDAPTPGSADTNIFVRFSDNNGATWSAPTRVNDDTGTNSQFLPAIAVDQTTGAVGVSWYDARNDVPGGSGNSNGISNDEAQLYASISVNGGVSFLPNVRVSAGTSRSAASEPPAQGVRPLGFRDYESADFYGGAFYPVWADNSNSTGDNPDAPHLDIYTSRVVAGGETITATGGTGDDTYFLRLDPSGTYVQIYENSSNLSGPPTFAALRSAVQGIVVNGGAGDDHLIIDFSNGSPLPPGGVTYDGGTTRVTGNTLVLQGGSTYNGETYAPSGPTSGSLSFRGIFAFLPPDTVTFSNVQQITDTVTLVAFQLGLFGVIPSSFVVDGTSSADSMLIANGSPIGGLATLQITSGGTLAPITFANKANVNVYGLAGNDTITLAYAMTATGLNTLLIDAGADTDLVNVLQTAANVPLTVNGGDGNDVINIGNGNLDLIRSLVTVHGGNGTDVVNLLDNLAPYNDTYTITSTTVSRPFFGGLSYDTLEALTLQGESGNNLFNITSTLAATPVFVNAGAGNDTINVGSSTTSLDAIQGAVTVNGQAGTDSLNVNDQAAAAGHTYTISPTALGRDTATTLVSFGTVENVNLTTSSHDDNLVLNGLPAGVPMTLNLGQGFNTVYGPNISNTWVINGYSNGEGSALLNGQATINGLSRLAGGSNDDRFVFMPGGAIPSTLNGLGGVNTLDYSAYNAGVTVSLGQLGLSGGTATGVGSGIVNIQVVIGSAFNDVLIGGPGNSILIGEGGADQLFANAGTPGFAILIAGTTDFDKPTSTNVAALNALARVWLNTTTGNYSAQVVLLRDTGVVAGGITYRLNSSSVHDDAVPDTLTGATTSQAALDWFFARVLSDGLPRNLKNGEIVTPI